MENLKVGQSFDVVEVITTKEIFRDTSIIMKYDGEDAEIFVNGDVKYGLDNGYFNEDDVINNQYVFFMFSDEFRKIGKLTITKLKC